VISVIIAPPSAPQILAQKSAENPKLLLDWLDWRILEVIRDAEPVNTWRVLNAVASEAPSRSRADGRALRLRLLSRIAWLKRHGLVFDRGRNEVTTNKSRIQLSARRIRRRRRTVVKSLGAAAVSAAGGKTCGFPPNTTYHSEYQSVRKVVPPGKRMQPREKTQSAITSDEASEAGRVLAKLPRKQYRKWTGWLHRRHHWRGKLVVLPDNSTAPIIWCSRGRVLLQNIHDFSVSDWLRWGALRKSDVKLWKNPAAVRLGAFKRGTREKPSHRKATASRKNGGMPPRPGSRPRGRHKKHSVAI